MFFLPPHKASEFMAWMVNHSTEDENNLFPNCPFWAIEVAGTKAEIKAQEGLNPFCKNSNIFRAGVLQCGRSLKLLRAQYFHNGSKHQTESSSLTELAKFQHDIILRRTSTGRLAGATSFPTY